MPAMARDTAGPAPCSSAGTLRRPMKTSEPFTADVLSIDARAGADEVCAAVKEQVMGTLHRRGVVVGLSGGVDSSVVAALAVRALGKEHVFGIFMPERDSHGDSLRLGRVIAEWLGIDAVVEEIGPALA